MTAESNAGADQRLQDLKTLVTEWLDWSQVAAELDIPVSRVGRLIKDHQLAAVVPTAGAGSQVPAGFVQNGDIVKGLSGLITLLHDGGYEDVEIITWAFTDDPTLPGRPIDALRENRGSEAKRRAQAMGF